MPIRSDIGVSLVVKESNGSRTLNADRYGRAIFHTGHNEFVICGGNGVVYTLDGIANKVQQAPGIPGAAFPDLVEMVQDYRDGSSTIVGNGVQIAIDDGSLDNWVVGPLGQSHNGIFTLAGDNLLYFILQRIVFSNDNYVTDINNGNDIFAFPGIQVIAQTKNGNRVVVANVSEVGFVDAGTDPDVQANWNIEANTTITSAMTQIAVNDSGSLAIMGTQRGDLIRWSVGTGTPILYSSENNPFVSNAPQFAGPAISSITYSSFWGGFIIYNSNGTQVGFVDETDFTTVQSAISLDRLLGSAPLNPQRSPISASNPAGEIIIAQDSAFDGPHRLLIVSPPS